MLGAADETTLKTPADDPDAEQSSPVVAGHYEIDPGRPLGSGGMAVVYRGRDLRTRREVALKTLKAEYRQDPETRARFRREARTMAFLAHPNVARVYDLYEDDDAPWAVLELVPGPSLKVAIVRNGPFDIEETARLLEQIASALDHLHDRGLVHLDVKPQNVLITPEGTVRLIDFGLAQRAGAPQEMIGGSTFGTAAYLSPEQACGDPVDAATDVYALGCVVYEMLTGQPPFGADPAGALKNDVIRAHLEREPDPPSTLRSLPPWVDDAVLVALAKRPADRYRDCASFAKVFLSALYVPEGIVTTTAPTARVARPPVVATHDEIFPRPRRSAVSAVARSFYRTGGKMARHTGPLRRLLWRATLALLAGNLLLAGILYLDRGEVPGVYRGEVELARGVRAEVMTDGLRLREAPGRNAAVAGTLALGQNLEILGDPVTAEGEPWWPVVAVIDGVEVDGYVAGNWIRPTGGPGEAWAQRAIAGIETWPGRALDRLLN